MAPIRNHRGLSRELREPPERVPALQPAAGTPYDVEIIALLALRDKVFSGRNNLGNLHVENLTHVGETV